MRQAFLAVITIAFMVTGFRARDSHGAVVAAYNFTAGAAASTQASGVTATDYAAGAGLGSSNFTGNASAHVFDQSTFALANSTGDYFTFSLTPTTGTIDLTSFSLSENVANTNQGPLDFEITINGTSINGAGNQRQHH